MPINSKVKRLYDALKADGGDVGTPEEFNSWFFKPGKEGYKNRKSVYDTFKADGADVGKNYEEFGKWLGLHAVYPTVNKYHQQMLNSVDPNKSRASELTHRAVSQAKRGMNNVRKPVRGAVVNKQGKKVSEFDITPAKTVEDLDREYAQETTKNWENELHDQMADADKDAAKISDMFKSFIGSMDEVGSVWGNMTRGGGIAGTPHSVTTNNGLMKNTEARQLLIAGDYNRKRRELLQLEQDSRNGAFFDNHSFFRGMYDAAKDTGFLTGGAFNLISGFTMLKTKQDLDNGVHTKAGDMLMQQAVKNSNAQSQYGDNQGWMYTGGVITTNMAPFIVQIASAGFSKGLSTSIGKVVQGAASKVALGTMKKAAGFASADLAKNIGKVTGLTTKAFGKAIQYGIVGAAQANTVGLGNVANDVINRYTGQVYQDEQGNYKFGTFDSDGKLVHEGGEDFLTAFVKGDAAQTIEFATELAGGGIDAVGTALKNFVTKGGKKIINKYNMENVSKVIDFLLNNKVSKNVRYLKAGADRTLGKVEVNSIVGESLEEELGIIANTVFTGDNKISDLWDEKQQSQIWGGMLLSIGLMKGVVAPFHAYNAKQYYSYKHKLNKADVNLSQLLGKEKWEELRNQIDATTNEDMPEMVNRINRDVALGKNRQPVREYIQNLLIMRGYDIGNMLAAKKAVEDKGEGVSVKNMEKNQAYQQGRDAYGYDTHEIQLDQEDKQKSLAQLLGISEQQLASMSDEELESFSGRDDNIDRAIYDYQLSSARYEGVVDNARDQIDLEVQRAAQAVDMYTDKSRNTIRNATIKASGGLEDYGVYIISGNIATHDDGSIDVSNSDDMILYYDPTTNTVEHADAMMFAELGSEENADEVRSQAMADAKEKAIKETTGIIDGVVEVGTQFKTVGADGTEHTYEVLADNGDGTAMITIDGNIPTELVKGENVNIPVSFEELQKMKDESDQQRLQAAKAQREQVEKERAEQQMQAQTTQAENPTQEDNIQSTPIEDNIDYSDIIREDGKVQMVDVSDKDGNNLFPDAKDVFYIQGNKMRTKFVYIDANGELKTQSFPTGLVKIKTRGEVSVDDYKKYRNTLLSAESSAIPESSMIEDNSGTIEANRGGIEVEDNTQPLSEADADNVIAQMESSAETAPDLELTPDNWTAEFGEDGILSTPIGDVKMGENQVAKLFEKGRSKEFGMIKPTLTNPDVIIEVPSHSADGNEERSSSYLFIKTFLGKNGKKVYYFKSVTIKKDGLEISISSNYDRAKRVKEALMKGKLLYRKNDGAQTEQNQPSTSVATSQEDAAGSSESKFTNISANDNENNESLTFEDGTPIPVDESGETDLSQTDAAHAAEWYDNNLGEDADDWLDGEIKKAKKVLEQAKNKKLAGTKPSELVASKKEKEAAIADAQAHYDSAISIRDSLKERRIAKEENTAEGRKSLIEKARRKFTRLKNSEEWSERTGDLWNETVGKLLHRLYDATGIDVFDDTPNTVYEYVAENVGPYSLNYEGNDNSKGVQQETGLSRSDFAKLGWLAAEGKGMTIDAKVHRLWENRPSNLESADTQEIRNALISLITSGQTAFQARDYILNQRIELAESALEEQLRQEEDAAEAQKAKEEEEKKKAELEKKAEEEKTNENRNTPELSHEQQKAMEEGEKLGFPAVDKEGEPINQNVIELANWAKEQGLEIDPTSKSNSYADLYVMCKEGFGVSTLVPDVGEDINQVFYFPDNVQGEQLAKLQEEFNVGRDLKHSADMNSELTEGVMFYDGDTAREFRDFVNEKVNEESKTIEVPEDATDDAPLGEQLDESDLPFSAKDNGQQQTTSERAADVEKNKVDDMKVVDNIVGQKTRKAFDRLAKMMGANIQWQYSDKLGNGWIQETTDADGNVHRTIFITLDSSITEGAQFIFGHEMTHQIKNLNPAAYDELTQLVLDTYGSDAFDKAVDETMQRYSDAGFSGRDRDYYAEEVVADAVGEMIRDLNLAHTLAMKMSHPLLAAIHEILQKIKLAFYGTEYSDATKNIIRSIEQAYVKTAKGLVENSDTGEDVSFSLRQKPEPKKKGVGYKVFVLKDGKLYPPMVANPDGAATPVGVWLDADAAPIAGESKTGRPQVKQGGKGTQGGSGKLAYRPGWHLGVVPYAIQFNRKDAEGNKTLFPKNFVFAEVEYAADVDYQDEARQEGINPSGKYQHSLAGLKHLPTDGYYMYRTNPNPETDPWVITGAMKVNRILTRAEQADLVIKAGREPQQIQEGDIVTDDVVNSINQEIADAPKFSLKVYHGSGADFTEFDFDHMGEGAGSQVFGWGGYVTSSKKIGKSYANLVDANAPYQDVEYVGNNAHEYTDIVAGLFNGGQRDYDDVKEFLQNGYNSDKDNARKKQMLEWFESTKPSDWKSVNDGKRNLYEVDIPDDNGSNYLDWENPLNEEQINAIRDALAKNGVDVSSWENRGFKLDLPFKDVYAAVLPMMMRCEPKEVSKFLSSLGFTGIKYPAGTIQGGAEEGDTNYVIFKPEDMKITQHTKFSLRLKAAIEETETNPSDAQKESGNYKKGHIKFGGYDYTIENPKGSTRSGKDADGKEWKITMHDTYGYIRGKFGKDGDHLDMFINDKADLDNWNGDVFVVDQVNPDGSFDEHKVMYGYDSMDDAEKAYLANYSDGWQGLGNITGASKDEFDKWLDTSNRKLKPFADYAKVKFSHAQSVSKPRYSLKDIKPIGVGAFGNIYNQFRGKSKAAIEFLKKLGSGEATAALHHHTIGDISLVWGDKKAGLDKILRKHPEVVDNLQSIIDSMEVVQESDNRVKLESPTHFAVVSKEYKGEPREQWLLTAYEKRESLENDKSMDTATSSLGGDTALSQSKGSAAKIDNSSETAKENGEKFSLKDEKTLAGVHNITEEKLRKAIKQGGLANPSVAVIDSSKQNHEDYGDISLILPSEKVAKRTGKNAGTWQGDAWTPTYPQVERQMSNNGAAKASKDVSSVPGDMYNEVRRGLDRWLDGGEGNSAMAYIFLHEKGVAPEPKKIQHKFSDDVYNELKSITAGDFNIYGIGKADAQKVLGMYIDAKFDGDKDLYEEKTKAWLERNKSIVDAGNKGGMRYTIAKENVELYDEYGFNYKSVQTFVRDVEYDHRKTGVDMNATLNDVEDYIKTNNLTDEFNTWLEGKEKEYGIKEVIFDGFTPSGNRRYVPNTLENVSKIMKKQGRNGATGISVSFQNFAASLMPSYGTLKDIRSKKGLLTSDHEDLDKFNEKWSKVFFELGMKCQPDATGTFDDYGLARLSEAAKTSDPQAYLKKEYNVDFSDGDTKRLKEMVKAIKEESPAMYFETKFERPVGFNEFSSAVVPTTASDEVKQALQNAGVQIYEYDKEKEGDRSRAFNEAINGSDNIRFSLKSMMEKPEGWKQANKKAIHIAEAIERDPKFSLKNLDGTLIKAGTYFSGGGLVEEGLKGIIDPVVAVEYDEKISGVYRNNFGQHIVTADVRDVDPKELVKQIDGEVEYFHASPVCKNYSQAKSNHAEVELDKETAASTAEFINAIKPKVVTIENVKGYKDSEAMKIITDALDANGYTWDADVYNAADYGGYTNRERLIVRAVRDGKLPEKPKKMAHKSGWYEAVADIIPTLTEKKNGVAPWMDIRLKADGIDWRNIDKPLYVMGSAYADGKIPHAFADELLPTLRTKSGDVIVMPDGKVYRAMGRVLARVSGVSDDYKMPFSENLSHTIIGNGIPTQLTEHVIAPLLQNTLRPTTPDDGNTKFSLRGSTPYDKQMEEWMEKNHLEKGAVPMEKPVMKEGENIFDYANRMVEWTRNQNLWKTAPKQTGFQDALDKWKADNGLSPDAYPPVRPHRENYSTEIGYTEDLEEYNKKKELWKSAPKPKDFDLSVDLEDMNKQLRNIRRAVLNQKNYDQRTVKAVSDLVRKMLNIGWGDGLSRGKVGNLLSAAKNATGANDVKKYLDKAMGILAENYLNRLSTAYDNLINTRGARADQSGVIKMGSLDAKGQAFMSEYKKAINMDDSSLNTYIANIEEDSAKNEDNVEMNDYRLAGIQAAIMYKQQIGGNDADISELKRQIGELKNKKDATKEDKDLLKSLEKKLFENKFDRITMYENLLNNIQRMVKESKGRAKEFREEITEHKNEILHRANLDLEGVDSAYYDTTTAKKKFVNNPILRFVMSSTYTFEQFLKFFGRHHANGEGYLYNYFMSEWQDAADEQQLYNEMNRNALDEKTKELFGKKNFTKLVGIDGKGMKEMDVEVTDYSNKETGKRTIHLKQGQMLYIYLVNKETDGEMKLRAMGITEEKVAEIEENLDPRVKAIGEWLQDEYLPECQRRYQATHTKYFGAPMKEVENYFPLAINNRARNIREDLNQDTDAISRLAGTSTGAIITRRVNVIPLDIENADAFAVAFNHLDEMEEWSAYLPFIQDVNTLLSSTHFRNQVMNMSSAAYGSGKTLWEEFKKVAQIAAGTYKPKVDNGMMDSKIAAVVGGIATAKISGRLWTAFKQTQSATTFLTECDPARFLWYGVNPYGSWHWAYDNLPLFRKRVEQLTAGDVKVRQFLDELEKYHDWTKTIAKVGMSPNILVDSVTCAVGARSVYETELNKLTKLGYSKDKAEEKAIQKASLSYNKTQQSSEGAFLSPMQVDRTYVSAALSLYKNANYAYGRKKIEAIRGIAKTYRFWGEHKNAMIGSMTRQIMDEDGLDENVANAIAKRAYTRTFWYNIGTLLNYMTIVPISWAAYKVLLYLLNGDDDDKKKKMIEEACLKGFATTTFDDYVIPFASNVLNAGLNIEDGKIGFDTDVFKYQNLYINPATSDLSNIYSMIGNQKWWSAGNKFGMLGIQMLVGFNPETIGALYQAYDEFDKDSGNMPLEIKLAVLKSISAPEESIRGLYMDELGLDNEDRTKVPLSVLEQRYAERQINRDNLLSQIAMPKETFDGYVEKYKKSFEKKIQDKMDKMDAYDQRKFDAIFDTTTDPALKGMMEKKRTKDANAAADEQIAKEGLNQEKKGKEPSEEAYDAVKMSIDVAEDNAISTYNKVLNKRYAALNDEYNNQTDAMKYIFMSKHPNFKAYKDLESEYTTYGKKMKELKEKLVSADGYDAKQTILKQIRAEREKFSELQSKVR
jgi:site-specific DNA-cytosine methylase|nr:MAG TPA: Cytosine specific methyltransferase [Caudoviricetes sp.]